MRAAELRRAFFIARIAISDVEGWQIVLSTRPANPRGMGVFFNPTIKPTKPERHSSVRLVTTWAPQNENSTSPYPTYRQPYNTAYIPKTQESKNG